MTLFFTEKNWGIQACAFKNFDQIEFFFKIMHSSLKLKAFGHALSPLSRIRKKSLIPFQKKREKNSLKKKMKGYQA